MKRTLSCGLVLLRLLLLFQKMKEIGVVLSPSCRVGMQRSQHLLTDGQGPLLEGLGLLILALPPVEQCQFMQSRRCVGMLRSLHLLTEGQGALVERVSLSILCTFF